MSAWQQRLNIFLKYQLAGSAWTVRENQAATKTSTATEQAQQSVNANFLSIQQTREAADPPILPDGLELTHCLLLRYKPAHQPFSLWDVQELIAGYVQQYQQQPSQQASPYLLYALSPTPPSARILGHLPFLPQQTGVYMCQAMPHIRFIALNQIRKAPHNALWHLFSQHTDMVEYGAQCYAEIPGLITALALSHLHQHYQHRPTTMTHTTDIHQEALRKETTELLLQELKPHERLEGLSLAERLEGIPLKAIEQHLAQQKTQTSPA